MRLVSALAAVLALTAGPARGAGQDVSLVYAFPVPWNPNGGDPAQGNRADGIRFTNLPSQGTIRIFNMAGQLVRSLDIPLNAATVSWDAKNSGGEEVSGGTNCDPHTGYLCLESEGSPVEFKNLRIRVLP